MIKTVDIFQPYEFMYLGKNIGSRELSGFIALFCRNFFTKPSQEIKLVVLNRELNGNISDISPGIYCYIGASGFWNIIKVKV